MSLTCVLNTAWMWRCRPEGRAFARATRDVAGAQARLLRTILNANRDTHFGRHFQFGSIRTPREFQSRVPFAEYEDLRPWIDRGAAGERSVLTAEPIRLFEPTSGSTGGEKLIPYTDALRRQFQRGIATWVADLFTHRPALRSGRAYWSISPAFGEPRRTAGGVPIGFDDDAAYLGRCEQWALRRLLVTPPGIGRIQNAREFQYVTLLHLLAAADLTFISIWNPSFLTVILDELEAWSEQVSDDLRCGKIRGAAASVLRIKTDARRADAIASIIRSTKSNAERIQQLWPNLALVSCWADASAATPYDQLQTRLPQVEMQPKGLLATEGFITLPLVEQPAPALAVRSHFFEFLPAANMHDCRLAHELETGGRYRVVLTTGGGLYRYLLHDEVHVVRHLHACPLLRFMGRTNRSVDLAGEKLNEAHVAESLESVFQRHYIRPQFVLVAPTLDQPPRYRLFLQCQGTRLPESLCREVAHDVEAALRLNPHYRFAVDLRQLAPVELVLLDGASTAPTRLYVEQCQARGKKLGGIKPAALDSGTEWSDVFRPHTIAIVAASDHIRTTPTTIPAPRR